MITNKAGTNQFSKPPVSMLLNVQESIGNKTFPDIFVCTGMHQSHGNYIVAQFVFDIQKQNFVQYVFLKCVDCRSLVIRL